MEYTQDSNSSKLKRKSDQLEHDEKLNDEFHNEDKRYEDEELNSVEYDSDSSIEHSTDNENNGWGMEEKSNEKNGKGDEDMFLSDNDDLVKDHRSRKKSKIQLLNIAEFKKENLADLDYQIGNTESQEEEKSVNIEPFNIDDEIEHGVFDKDGNYIKTENDTENELQDNEEWMNDVINAEETNRLEKEQNVKTQDSRHYMVHEALILLKFFLAGNHETVLESLGRLNKLRKIAISKRDNSLKYVIHGIELLSDLINLLEKKGFSEIYEYDRGKVQDAIVEEFFDDSSKIVDHKTKLWNFKWLNKLDEYHGLYTNYEMSYWQKSYFKNNVVVKFHSEPDRDENWVHISCLRFM